MDEKRSVLAIGLTLMVLIAAAVGVYFLFFRAGPVTDSTAVTSPSKADAARDKTAEAIPVFPPTPLNDSDQLRSCPPIPGLTPGCRPRTSSANSPPP
jgi:hypothetical protein